MTETKQGWQVSKTLLIVMWTATAVWFGIVFFLSSQTGADTASLSWRLSVFLGRILKVPASELPAFHSNLRTSAHIVVYFVLSLLAYASVRLSFPNSRISWLYVTGICSLFAVFDEIRKAYIPGRHCSYPEAGLNIAGVLAGVITVALFYRIACAKHSRNNT